MRLLHFRADASALFSCLRPAPTPPPARSPPFVAAVRAYDWALASSLARTREERRVRSPQPPPP
eukprot:1587470-Prymnesium_polylepis.1